MLLTHARHAARTGPGGELIPLDEQDRGKWDRAAIAEGVTLASAALAKGSVGEYQLLAAIAAVHDEAPRAEDTDWTQIRALYSMLNAVAPGPMVILAQVVRPALHIRSNAASR
jgi:predicted RNA polymerase sigma factor